MRLDQRRFPNGIKWMIKLESSEVDQDVSDQISLIGWRANDSVSGRFEQAAGKDWCRLVKFRVVGIAAKLTVQCISSVDYYCGMSVFEQIAEGTELQLTGTVDMLYPLPLVIRSEDLQSRDRLRVKQRDTIV